MLHIVSDSSILYSQKDAKEKLGVYTTPLSVTVNGKSYREFEEIDPKSFIEIIEEGHHPSSSQPAIGEKIELYEKLSESGEVLDITMADGLSGTYNSACGAKSSVDNEERIHVFNSRTLCGPHQFMVEKASELLKNNKTIDEIIEILEKGADSEISFLIPFDFSFLVRGGRVNGLVGGVGALLKLIPVMSKTDDGKRLEKYSIARTMKKAVADVIEGLKKKGCDGTYHFFVSHAFNDEVADKFIEAIKNEFDTDNIKKLLLSPAFITQGGPKCVAIQAIKL